MQSNYIDIDNRHLFTWKVTFMFQIPKYLSCYCYLLSKDNYLSMYVMKQKILYSIYNYEFLVPLYIENGSFNATVSYME